MSAGGNWNPKDTGPVVRPYAVTGGRTEPADGEVLDIITLVVASGQATDAGDPMALSPEHRRIVGLCREPAAVADIASETTLPLGVVRVLLADLILQGRVTVLRQQHSAGEPPPADLLREVLHGLRAL